VCLLEVGSSAGLTLLVDHYEYIVGDQLLGDPDSPLRFDQPWVGLPPASLDRRLRVVERRGCDLSPVDPTSTEGQRTLMSYVWADWIERIERLRRALQVAAANPPPVDRATAAAWLAARLAAPRAGVVTVVWHSIVWQYLDWEERAAVDAVLTVAAARATAEAPLARLAFEPRRDAERAVRFELRLTMWPGTGESEVLAHAPRHGLPTWWGGDVPDG
jgi:hypothetical protein